MTGLIVTADDFGLTESVNDGIMNAVDAGCVNSVSVLANGYAFEHAADCFRKRAGLALAVHLNLCEGKPVAPREAVNLLVNAEGDFHYSFQGLWLRHLRSNAADRKLLKEQIKVEFAAQISAVKRAFAIVEPIAVNSHQHFHHLPFVFEALLELGAEHRFRYIRMADEPLYPPRDAPHFLRNIFSANSLKYLLLKHFSRRHKRALHDRAIACTEAFFGVLYAGRMTEATIRAALLKTRNSIGDRSGLVELLVHPGRAARHEAARWRRRPELSSYYCSPWREAELRSVTSPAVAELLSTLRAGQ